MEKGDTSEGRAALRTASLALFEQGTASAGSFVFFYLLARLLGPAGFGTLSAAWAAVLFVMAVETQWVLLPVTSMRVEEGKEKTLFGVLLRKHVGILLLTPILLPLALGLALPAAFGDLYLQATSIALCLAVVTVEFVRYYLIRSNQQGVSLILVGLKWGLSIVFVVVAWVPGFLSPLAAAGVLCVGSALALGGIAPILRRRGLNVRSIRDPAVRAQTTSFSKPLLLYGLVVSTSAVLTATIINTWLGVAAFGAYQAIRALCNFLSVFMQIADTHYSAYLVTRNQRSPGKSALHVYVLLAGLAAAAVSFPVREWLIGTVLGEWYLPYADLLPILLLMSFVLLANRFLAARLRAAGRTGVYYVNAGVTLAGTAATAALAAARFEIVPVVVAVALVPVVQFVVLLLASRGFSRSTATMMGDPTT